jgi:hypothetical protein
LNPQPLLFEEEAITPLEGDQFPFE